MKPITKNTTVGAIVMQKGMTAGEMLDKEFCTENGTYCPGVTVTLETAAKNSNVEDALTRIIHALNRLPDIR